MRKKQWLCVLCFVFHAGLATCTCPENEYQETRLFPPADARTTCFPVDNNGGLSRSCDVTGENYGNGAHALQFSSQYSTAYSPHTMFNSEDVTYGNDAAFASGQYNSNGIFVGSGQLNSDYPGDYIAISMPSKVRVTRIAMYMQTYEYQDYTVFAKKYQVLGRNSASDSWQKIHEEMDAMDSLFYDPIKCTRFLDEGKNCMHRKEITTDHSFSQIAVVFETKQPSEYLYVSLAELNIYGTSAETCTSCPTDGTFVSGCPCPAETHFGSPGALVAFNPSSASEESFTRVALNSKNVGETSWPLQTSSGFTLITKFKFTGTGAWFENVAFFGKDGSIGTIWLRRYGSGSEELLDFRIYQGSSGISTDSKCTIQSAAGSAPQNTVLNIIARWDGSVIELDINGVKASADCSLVMQNRVLSETYIGSSFIDASIGGFVDSSRFLLGDMYGMYAWPRHLSDSEAAQVLTAIEIGGPDTLPTLQCTSCPAGMTSPAGSTSSDACVCEANSYLQPKILDKDFNSFSATTFQFSQADPSFPYGHLAAPQMAVENGLRIPTLQEAQNFLSDTSNCHPTTTNGMTTSVQIPVVDTSRASGYNYLQSACGHSAYNTVQQHDADVIVKMDGSGAWGNSGWNYKVYLFIVDVSSGISYFCQSCFGEMTSLAVSTSISACGCPSNSYGPHGPLDGLVGMFGLNGDTDDEIGTASIQMYSGTATFVQDADRGQVLDNGATEMYIESAVLSNALDQDAWSISLWFKASSWSTYLHIANRYDITTGANGQRGGFSFGLLNTGKFFLQRQREGANSWINCQASTTITANTWYHVVAISEPRNLKVYLNGNVGTADCDVSSTTDWAHTQIDLPPKIGLGLYCVDWDSAANDCYVHSSGTNDGYRQDLRFYNRVLTSDEIVELAARKGEQANICAACPTDGTVVEGCQPPCVDGTSFSYWSIRKSVCP